MPLLFKCVELACTASLIKPINYLKTTKTRRRNNNQSRLYLIPISRYAPTHAPWKNKSDLRN